MCRINLKKVMYRRKPYDDSLHTRLMEPRMNDIIPLIQVLTMTNRHLNTIPEDTLEDGPLRQMLIFLYEFSEGMSDDGMVRLNVRGICLLLFVFPC